MRFAVGIAVLGVTCLTIGRPSLAAVCQGRSMTLGEIVDAVQASPGCDRAMTLFKDCQFGTSGDIQLGAAVERKCEVDFLRHLPAAQKTTYRREMNGCDSKYRNEEGTMYRSFTAFCRAEVARRYSHQALKAAR